MTSYIRTPTGCVYTLNVSDHMHVTLSHAHTGLNIDVSTLTHKHTPCGLNIADNKTTQDTKTTTLLYWEHRNNGITQLYLETELKQWLETITRTTCITRYFTIQYPYREDKIIQTKKYVCASLKMEDGINVTCEMWWVCLTCIFTDHQMSRWISELSYSTQHFYLWYWPMVMYKATTEEDLNTFTKRDYCNCLQMPKNGRKIPRQPYHCFGLVSSQKTTDNLNKLTVNDNISRNS